MAGDLRPVFHRVGLHFAVELERVGPAPDAHRLAAAGRRASQDHGSLGRLGDAHVVPLQGPGGVSHTLEQRVAPALAGKRDREYADLRRLLGSAGSTERVRQQLMSEADAEEGALEFAHETPDRALLLDNQRMLIDVRYIDSAAHHPKHVVALERRDPPALVELDGVPGDALRAQPLTE